MTHPNEAVARAWLAAFNRYDVDALVQGGRIVASRVYHG